MESHHDQGLRNRLGAAHVPLATLLNRVIDSGFELQRVTEGARPTPLTLSFRATPT
jgi:hypothetical protein